MEIEANPMSWMMINQLTSHSTPVRTLLQLNLSSNPYYFISPKVNMFFTESTLNPHKVPMKQ